MIMKSKLVLFIVVLFFISCNSKIDENIGATSITKWPENKRSAVSITFDDGIINQLTVARPILNKLGLVGTFYVITGKIEGATKGKFIGRPADEIINETKTQKTDAINFFERASLIAFTGTTEAVEYHSNAGALFEAGKYNEAYKLIDEGYRKIRNRKLKNTNEVVFHDNAIDTTSWNEYRKYVLEGHEIASHTVTHARLAVLDEVNMRYELEQSKADIEQFLGKKSTFSAECPYGTENERVMEIAHKIYPSLRNRMPALYLEEINRSSKKHPSESEKEYVQWQRGPLTNHSMELMKSWVDDSLKKDNVWLVLVFHGVDGVGWQPKTEAELETYFKYINTKKDKLWVATFADVTKYIRERKSTTITNKIVGNSIQVTVLSELDLKVYDIPITLKTYVPKNWKMARLSIKPNSKKEKLLKIQKDTLGSFIVYEVKLNVDNFKVVEGF